MRKLIGNLKLPVIESAVFAVVGIMLVLYHLPNFKFRQLYFYSFMDRDISRALEVLNGNMIFFGPETSGGGYLPGPLYYFVLAAALWFVPTWKSCFLLLLGVHSATGFLGAKWFAKRFNLAVAMVFLILFIFSHPIRSFVLLFLNVSFLLPFAFAGVLFTVVAYSDPDPKKRARGLRWLCISVAAGTHFHGSILCLAGSAAFLQFMGWFKGWTAPRPKDWVPGLALGSVFFVPYVVWKVSAATGHPLGQLGSYVANAPGAFATMNTMVAYSLEVPFETTISEVGIRLMGMIPLVLACQLITMVAVGLWEIFRTQKRTWTFIDPASSGPIRAILSVTAFAFIPFSYVFLVHMGRRYGMVFCFSLLFLAAILFNEFLRSPRLLKIFNVVSALCVIVLVTLIYLLNPGVFQEYAKLPRILLGVLPVLILYPYMRTAQAPWRAGLSAVFLIGLLSMLQYETVSPRILREKLVPRFDAGEWKKVWRVIYYGTGWSYEEALNRTYFVNLRLDEDPRPIYHDVRNDVGEVKAVDLPDGYFVLNNIFLRRAGKGPRVDPAEWILEQNIPDDIRQGLKSGQIRLGPYKWGATPVIAFWVDRNAQLPRYFRSSGLGYRLPEEKDLLASIPGAAGAARLGAGEYLFKWNECPDLNSFCSTGAVVKTAYDHATRKVGVKVRVFGSAISQNSPWISPNWTQAWIKPYVEMECGGQKHKLQLFSSIGMRRDYGSNEFNELLQANNSVVAPFFREFEWTCAAPPRRIALGREGSEVEQIVRIQNLPARRLEVEIAD